MSTRRDLLAALMALAAAPGFSAAAPSLPDLDRNAVRRIGQAWRDSHPEATERTLSARLFPAGRGPEALPALRAAVAADFRAGRIFIHRGWRLSDTEGALFALLAMET
ncbi:MULTISPECIES: hypothetical protein [unclassified Caulobacter]|uniref:hypothetical protein n=1 Tax=unclassified Caulobacter TaxID=2648921 RepID=UPI000C15A6B1|nr:MULTISPECIES: hypothetical protein [unclassified Caulobacter]AZS21232.1 hypothetical protein CSW63_11585 [Caulobacter sp. FWC26]